MVNIFGSAILQLLPLFPFFFILTIISFKKWKGLSSIDWFNKNKDILFILLLILSAMAAWALLFWTTPDAVEFFSNAFIPLSVIMIVLITALLLNARSLIVRSIAVLLFFVCMVQDHFFRD